MGERCFKGEGGAHKYVSLSTHSFEHFLSIAVESIKNYQFVVKLQHAAQMTEEWFYGWGQLAVYSTLQHNWLNCDLLDEVTHISVWQGVYVSQSSIVTHFHLPSSYGWWLYLGTEKLARWTRHWFKWDGEFHKTFDMIEQMSQLLNVVCLYWMEWEELASFVTEANTSYGFLRRVFTWNNDRAIESGALQVCSPVKGAVCYAKEEMQGGSVPVVAKVRI